MTIKIACKFPSCSNLTTSKLGYCSKHKTEKEKDRPSSSERGYNARWRKARLMYLKEHPLCQFCLDYGLSVAATVVDHRLPHKGNQELFWDVENWQPLCATCHNRKTAEEDGGFGRQSKYR